MIRYRLYPSLLNNFTRFSNGLLSEQELLQRVNRVPIPQTRAQAMGVSFEMAVIKGIDEDQFDYNILKKARALLPKPMVATQVYCEYPLDQTLIYGFVDVIGTTLAVDLKSTKKYTPGRFEHDHQNFYLPALGSKGIRNLRYVITDFTQVYEENYDLNTDLSHQQKEVKLFCEFLEAHREAITDAKVFVES